MSRFVRSYVIAGMLLLVVLNAVLSTTCPFSHVDPESLPAAHTWVWWATREYLEQKRPPDVVLLGSSLLMHPISRLDANYLNRDLDYIQHHRCLYMEDTLAQRLGLKKKEVVCYNFALPGGMISDNYIIVRALCCKTRKPSTIVLGISIRDFIDNGVHCAGATPAFRYLKRYANIDDLMDLAMPQPWQRADYLIGRVLYLWGKKLDLQVMLAESTKQFLSPYCKAASIACKLPEAERLRHMPSNLRAEVEEGMFIVKAHQPFSYEDNSAEYAKRYKSGNDSMFAIQLKFLNKLIELARQENIHVVLFNMPLTAANRALMPARSYERYLNALQGVSKYYCVPLINLDTNRNFEKQDFYDTAHMNAHGGKKLADVMISCLVSDKGIASALKTASYTKAQVASQTKSF